MPFWVTNDPDQIDLAWEYGDAGSQTRVYLDGAVDATKSAGVTAHSIIDLESNTAYEVGLRHLENGIFNPIESVAAVTINVTTATGTLGAPQSLATQTVDPYAVKLTWAVGSPAPSGTYYLIERSDTDVWGGEEETVTTTGAGILTYTHSDIDEATNTWYFRVTAKRTNWNDSNPTASVSGDYGVGASMDSAHAGATGIDCNGGCATVSGCTTVGNRILVRWNHTGGDDAVHHIDIWRSADNGATYPVEAAANLSVDEVPECGVMANYNGGYAFFFNFCDEGFGARYKWKVELRLDAGDALVTSVETANVFTRGTTVCAG